MNDYLASSITYSIVPPLLASYLQRALYSSNVISPQHPQSPQFHRDKRIIYTFLVFVYLVYTTYTAYTELKPNYYDILGVSTAATATELRSRFKILSKSLHPDKSATTSAEFLVVRHAYQVLLNPLKRQAYDLFGPMTSQWDFPTERQFLFQGIAWGVLPSFTISFIALQVWGLFGRGGLIKYWRYLLFLTLFVFEMHVLLHPRPPILRHFPTVISSLPRFQLLSLFHKISLSLTLSLEHLAPLYTPPLLSTALLARAEMVGINALGEGNRLLAGEFRPILDETAEKTEKKEIIAKLKEDIVESILSERLAKNV